MHPSKTIAAITASLLIFAGAAHASPVAAQGNGLAQPGLTAPNQKTALASPAPLATESDGIAAIVNSDIIADYDVQQRVALYLATSGVRTTADIVKKIRGQAIDQLVAEKLEIQEARKQNVTISAPEIDKELNRIVSDNHITTDQLKQTLEQKGASITALRQQIAAQVVWQKVVEQEFGDRVDITDADIDAEMKRLAEGKDRTHFRVSEIFLAVDTPDQDARVQKNIGDLKAQLDAGAPFQVIARQFSQSPSAASGGDIDWVYDGQLAPELNASLQKMQAGAVSDPIRSLGGYYILQLRERAEASNVKLPDPTTQAPSGPVDRLPLARLLLPISPKSPPGMMDQAMKFAGELEDRIITCAQLQAIAAKIHGVYQDMGMFRVKDLSESLQTALAKTQSGQSVPPFSDAAGVEVIYRCDKVIPRLQQYQMPTRQEVQERLFDQQVTAFARRYMRDLRRQADIEIR